MGYAEPDPVSEEELESINKDLEKPEGGVQRAKAALAMKIAGANYSDIAETLGYSDVIRARGAVEAAMAATVDDDSRKKARGLINLRYERLLMSVWGKATSADSPEHLSAARTALAIVERMAKLNGAERPAEVVVYTPLLHEINEELKKIAGQAGGDLPQEVDIIEGTVLEDSHDQTA